MRPLELMTRNQGTFFTLVVRNTAPTSRARRGNRASCATPPYVHTRPRGMRFTASSIRTSAAEDERRGRDCFFILRAWGLGPGAWVGSENEEGLGAWAWAGVRTKKGLGCPSSTILLPTQVPGPKPHALRSPQAPSPKPLGRPLLTHAPCPTPHAPCPMPRLNRNPIVHRLLRAIRAIRIAASLAARERDAERRDERENAFEKIAGRVR